MNDHDFVKEIILYLYGELSKKETIKLNRHIEKCDNCRLELQRLRETMETFQQVEMLEPSPSCGEAVRRLAREKLTVRTSWLNKARRFPERFALRMPRPVTVSLGLLILLVALSLYISHEKALFPFRGKMPGETEEMTKWENGTEDSLELLEAEVERIKEGEDSLSLWAAEEKLSLDDTISDLQDEMKMVKWAMQVSEDSILDWEVANLEREISYLSSELNGI